MRYLSCNVVVGRKLTTENRIQGYHCFLPEALFKRCIESNCIYDTVPLKIAVYFGLIYEIRPPLMIHD